MKLIEMYKELLNSKSTCTRVWWMFMAPLWVLFDMISLILEPAKAGVIEVVCWSVLLGLFFWFDYRNVKKEVE